MSTDSTSTNSSPNNNETLRLSTDSNEQMDANIPKQSNQTKSGYFTRSKKAVSYTQCPRYNLPKTKLPPSCTFSLR